MRTECPYCQKIAEVDNELEGMVIECRDCGREFHAEYFGYNSPVLAKIFQIGAVFDFLISAVIFILVVANWFAGNRDDIFQETIVAVLFIIMGVTSYGVAEIISAICRTAYNSNLMLAEIRKSLRDPAN